ncbi:MAG: thymidylate synthase, partial [Desulfurococcaceae archaeon]
MLIDTEYGEKSIDAPAVIIVKNPHSEPRIHLKGIVAGSLKGLLDYVDEVIKGIHDHLVEKIGYTYHERLFNYRLPNDVIINQIDEVIKKLKKAPYTRRAQAITWQPWKDLEAEHPPCLQRIWFRVVEGKLAMHAHM